jgi:hypothetical protein
MSENPPRYPLEEIAEVIQYDYGYLCSRTKALGLGHLEERRAGSQGPRRRLLDAGEIRRFIEGLRCAPQRKTALLRTWKRVYGQPETVQQPSLFGGVPTR